MPLSAVKSDMNAYNQMSLAIRPRDVMPSTVERARQRPGRD